MVNIIVRWSVLSILLVVNLIMGNSIPDKNAFVRMGEAKVHPFYVSVIELNHNAKAKTVEVSIRIFTEDLEATLSKFGKTKIDLLHPANKAAVDKLLTDYILQKLQLKLDDKAVVMHYIGHEQQLESTWTYLEVENVPTLKKAGINCSLLYDFQDKETNIFHVKANGVEKSNKLDYPQTNMEIVF